MTGIMNIKIQIILPLPPKDRGGGGTGSAPVTRVHFKSFKLKCSTTCPGLYVYETLAV